MYSIIYYRDRMTANKNGKVRRRPMNRNIYPARLFHPDATDLDAALDELDRAMPTLSAPNVRAIVTQVWKRLGADEWELMSHDHCEAQADSPTPPPTGQPGTPDFPGDFPTRPDMTQSRGIA